MLILNPFDLTDFIVRHHRSFAGHPTSKLGVRVYRQLREAIDFLNAEPAAESVNFEAELREFDENGWPIRTVVTISLAEDGKLRYEESIAY